VWYRCWWWWWAARFHRRISRCLSLSFFFLSFFLSSPFPLLRFSRFERVFSGFNIRDMYTHIHPPLSLTRSNPRDTVSLCAVGRSCDSLREKRPTIADIMSTHAGAAEAGRAGQQLQYVFYQVLLLPSRTKYACVGDVHTHT
jgi:hypothetical protein